MMPHERLQQARKRAGYNTASDAARAHDWPIQTYLGHENGSRGIRPESAKRYARAYNVSWVWITEGEGAQPKGDSLPPQLPPINASNSSDQQHTMAPGTQGRLGGPRDVKILGHSRGGTTGFFIDNGEIQGYAVRPEILSGSRDGYAVYCHDTSMRPAIDTGWLCYVDPMKPVHAGDDVVIQLKDGQAFIKRLVRRTERELKCEQFNPAGPVVYDMKDVKSVHLVVNTNRVRT